MAMPVISALDFTSEKMIDERIPEHTPMKDFFREKIIFLTGCTGSLGQVFFEKLLRCKVKRLYILIRSKTNESIADRLKKIYTSPLFGRLKHENPKYQNSIQIIDGDLTVDGLRISTNDRLQLIENVDFVIHAAVDIKCESMFIDTANVNINGAKGIVQLINDMKKKDHALVYISTVFISPPSSSPSLVDQSNYSYYEKTMERYKINEEFYEPPIDTNKIIKITKYFTNRDDNYILDILSHKLMKNWLNSYTYTAAIAEDIVRQAGTDFPVFVIRPSLIMSTHEDPVQGYNACRYGFNGVITDILTGYTHIFNGNANKQSNVVCSDFVVSASLASIFNLFNNENLNTNQPPPEKQVVNHEPKVLNVTINQNTLRWGDMIYEVLHHSKDNPTMNTIWMPYLYFMICKYQVNLYKFFFELIPYSLFDVFKNIMKQKSRIIPHYRIAILNHRMFQYFLSNEWNIKCDNVNTLYQRLCKHDQLYFPCDLNGFYWQDFSYKYTLGIKKYLLNENLNNTQDALSKLKTFKIIHFGLWTIYCLIFGYCLLNIFVRFLKF